MRGDDKRCRSSGNPLLRPQPFSWEGLRSYAVKSLKRLDVIAHKCEMLRGARMAAFMKLRRGNEHFGQRQLWGVHALKDDHGSQFCGVRFCATQPLEA